MIIHYPKQSLQLVLQAKVTDLQYGMMPITVEMVNMQIAVRETMVDGALLEKDFVACLQMLLVEMLEGLLMHGGGVC